MLEVSKKVKEDGDKLELKLTVYKVKGKWCAFVMDEEHGVGENVACNTPIECAKALSREVVKWFDNGEKNKEVRSEKKAKKQKADIKVGRFTLDEVVEAYNRYQWSQPCDFACLSQFLSINSDTRQSLEDLFDEFDSLDGNEA